MNHRVRLNVSVRFSSRRILNMKKTDMYHETGDKVCKTLFKFFNMSARSCDSLHHSSVSEKKLFGYISCLITIFSCWWCKICFSILRNSVERNIISHTAGSSDIRLILRDTSFTSFSLFCSAPHSSDSNSSFVSITSSESGVSLGLMGLHWLAVDWQGIEESI